MKIHLRNLSSILAQAFVAVLPLGLVGCTGDIDTDITLFFLFILFCFIGGIWLVIKIIASLFKAANKPYEEKQNLLDRREAELRRQLGTPTNQMTFTVDYIQYCITVYAQQKIVAIQGDVFEFSDIKRVAISSYTESGPTAYAPVQNAWGTVAVPVKGRERTKYLVNVFLQNGELGAQIPTEEDHGLAMKIESFLKSIQYQQNSPNPVIDKYRTSEPAYDMAEYEAAERALFEEERRSRR